MYRSFYNLKLKPFQINSDPLFLWTGEKHEEALATLKYGILNNKRFLLLTGDVGTGKTTLINALIQSLDDDIICASVPDSSLEFIDFINHIAFSFGMEPEFKTKGDFIIKFRKFLLDAYRKRKKVLLIIDEAQLLTDELLEQIRLLSNIDLTDIELLNIFFVGQNEFNDILSKKNNHALRQRLTLNYNIDPLTAHETNEYIKYRLNVAGTKREIFSPRAVKKIYQYSQGFPRRINIICDHCLLSGYVNEKREVDKSIVNECARELEIPSKSKQRDSVSKLIKKPKKNKRYLIALFTILLCTGFAILFFLNPSIVKQATLIINDAESSLKTKLDKLPDKSNHEKKEKIELIEETGYKKKISDNKGVDSWMPSGKPYSIIKTSEEPLPPLEIKKIIIRFKSNTNNFKTDDISIINEFADRVTQYPKIQLIVTGYTDSTGHPEYNKKLSQFRANIVKSFFMGKGIKPEKIQAKGLGNANPIERNDSPFGRMMNRRVEIEVYQDDY